MEIKVHFAGNKKIQAQFDGFTLTSDQPLDSGGEGSAPSPFDFFLSSIAMCAGYFIKAYCDARKISTEGILISQVNTKDLENKYKQTFDIRIQFPDSFSAKDKEGIVRSIEGCSVKKSIQQVPEFKITAI